MSLEELERGFRRLAVELYGETATRRRRESFRRTLREQRAGKEVEA